MNGSQRSLITDFGCLRHLESYLDSLTTKPFRVFFHIHLTDRRRVAGAAREDVITDKCPCPIRCGPADVRSGLLDALTAFIDECAVGNHWRVVWHVSITALVVKDGVRHDIPLEFFDSSCINLNSLQLRLLDNPH